MLHHGGADFVVAVDPRGIAHFAFQRAPQRAFHRQHVLHSLEHLELHAVHLVPFHAKRP